MWAAFSSDAPKKKEDSPPKSSSMWGAFDAPATD